MTLRRNGYTLVAAAENPQDCEIDLLMPWEENGKPVACWCRWHAQYHPGTIVNFALTAYFEPTETPQ